MNKDQLDAMGGLNGAGSRSILGGGPRGDAWGDHAQAGTVEDFGAHVVGTSGTVSPDYLVWSNEHRAWWRANSAGYSKTILGAGLYYRRDALTIAHWSRNGWGVEHQPAEIAVALADLPPDVQAALLARPA